jgi:hypothetical protein
MMRPEALVSELRKIDWDFAGTYSESSFSAIHWYPARFVSQMAAALIGMLSSPGDAVLDPFVGSGTTCVEAQRLGRRSIGIDLNPIACLVSRAKTVASSAQSIRRIVDDLEREAEAQLTAQIRIGGRRFEPSEIPGAVQLDKWYSPPVQKDLRALWSLVRDRRGACGAIARAAFSAVLLPVCRETRHWGYVCDNSTPKGHKDCDVLGEFTRTLDQLAAAYVDRDADLRLRNGGEGKIERADLVLGDAQEVLGDVDSRSVNLVLTSPPYFGVSDYVKAQRLSMEWFGFGIEPLRLREIGARSKRHRRSARDDYLKELGAVFEELRRCLRRGGLCAVVVGESANRDAILADLREVIGGTGMRQVADLNRRVSSQRRQNPSITGEHLMVFER